MHSMRNCASPYFPGISLKGYTLRSWPQSGCLGAGMGARIRGGQSDSLTAAAVAGDSLGAALPSTYPGIFTGLP